MQHLLTCDCIYTQFQTRLFLFSEGEPPGNRSRQVHVYFTADLYLVGLPVFVAWIQSVKKKKKSKVKLWIHELYYLLCDPSLYKLFSSLSLLQPSPTQTEVPAGGLTVGGVDSVCWWQKPAAPSVSARRNAGPPSCRCVARTAGSTRTTARSTAPPAWRGDGSTWCTARTASLKVPLEHWCSDTAEGPCAL